MTFNNKTVIVTGAANGIGREVARAFSRENAYVIIADTDEYNGKTCENEIRKEGGKAQFIRTDVADPSSITSMVTETNDRFGSIDILINNAGISEFIPVHEISVDQWDRILNTNLRGCFLCTREAAKSMQSNGGGSVVNIASTRALMSEPHSEAYAASKGGIVALTHAMAISLAKSHIRVNSISPGWIHTGDYDKLRDIDHEQHPSRRVGKPEDIARACLYLTQPENDFITGENLIIDGGMTRKMIYEH